MCVRYACVSVCVSICMCKCLCMCARVYECVCECVHVQVYVNVHIFSCVRAPMCTCGCVPIQALPLQFGAHIYVSRDQKVLEIQGLGLAIFYHSLSPVLEKHPLTVWFCLVHWCGMEVAPDAAYTALSPVISEASSSADAHFSSSPTSFSNLLMLIIKTTPRCPG